MTTTNENRTRSTRAAKPRVPLFHQRGAAALSAPRLRALRANAAFTLVEILVVVCVITLLIGLTANAAFSARQRAYVSQATTECEQLCSALKTYRLAAENGKLPFDTRGGWTQVSRDLIADFIGGGKDGTVLLDIADDRFEDVGGTDFYCDPWGNPYEIRTVDPSADEGAGEAGEGEAGNIVLDEIFEVVVSFPNQFGRAADGF